MAADIASWWAQVDTPARAEWLNHWVRTEGAATTELVATLPDDRKPGNPKAWVYDAEGPDGLRVSRDLANFLAEEFLSWTAEPELAKLLDAPDQPDAPA